MATNPWICRFVSGYKPGYMATYPGYMATLATNRIGSIIQVADFGSLGLRVCYRSYPP